MYENAYALGVCRDLSLDALFQDSNTETLRYLNSVLVILRRRKWLAVAKSKSGDLYSLSRALEEFATPSHDREWGTTPRLY
jgi:hypothetical protein